jgi:hypothetical protein
MAGRKKNRFVFLKNENASTEPHPSVSTPVSSSKAPEGKAPSGEFIFAAFLGLLNFALDQADIHIMLISWLSMIAISALLADGLRRTPWAVRVGSASLQFRVSVAIVIILPLCFGLYLSHHKPERPLTADEIAQSTVTKLTNQDNAKTAVELECRQDRLPIRVAPNDVAHVMLVNRRARTGGGLFDVMSGTTKNYSWPPKAQLSKRKGATFNPGEFIYRCEVSNQGNTKLLDVALTFNLNYWTPPPSDKQVYPYQVVVNPLTAGTTFTFFVVNECPVGADAIALGVFSTRILGENTRRNFELLMPHRNPVEPIMMLWPSSVSWTGEVCN